MAATLSLTLACSRRDMRSHLVQRRTTISEMQRMKTASRMYAIDSRKSSRWIVCRLWAIAGERHDHSSMRKSMNEMRPRSMSSLYRLHHLVDVLVLLGHVLELVRRQLDRDRHEDDGDAHQLDVQRVHPRRCRGRSTRRRAVGQRVGGGGGGGGRGRPLELLLELLEPPLPPSRRAPEPSEPAEPSELPLEPSAPLPPARAVGARLVGQPARRQPPRRSKRRQQRVGRRRTRGRGAAAPARCR